MYETKKLYYEDVYKKEFTAKVLECRESKKGYEIILNQTAFYPEGGGQPSDTGILGGINVKEVHEKDGELIHYTDGPLEVGMDVIGKINWGRRFDLMQQHSGEHIVSGLVHEAFGYDNVGFHMGSDVITIDFNGMLDEEQMAEIEAKVNQIIWENQEVEIFYPTEEELKNLDYRSKKELSGWVRMPEMRLPRILLSQHTPHLPMQELSSSDLGYSRNRNAPNTSATHHLVLGHLPLRNRQTRHFC